MRVLGDFYRAEDALQDALAAALAQWQLSRAVAVAMRDGPWFEQGEVSWPEEAPFHTPVYVLTHEKREPT